MRKAGGITAALLVAALKLHAASGTCTEKSSFYDGYRVVKVQINDPILFLTPWTGTQAALKAKLRLKESGAFTNQSFNDDNELLSATYKTSFAASPQKFKFAYVSAQIQDCDVQARTLRVVFTVFSSVAVQADAPTVEQQNLESQRPATTGASRAAGNGLLLTPLHGYNDTRGFFGGLNGSFTSGWLTLRGESEVSANSRLGHLDMIGHVGLTEWAGTFHYRDTPAGAARLEEGTVSARLTGRSRELGGSHTVWRYGASVEGGHQQSSDTADSNSSYGSLKLYTGVTGRSGDQAFTASYGLQLGSELRDGTPVFKKHLADLGYSTRIPIPRTKSSSGSTGSFQGPLSPTVHKSIDLDTRLTAGLIQGAAGAPLAERFLGGNQVRPFVDDNSWILQSDAYIRSLRENQLGATLPAAAVSGARLGGARFYSANVTAAFPLWGSPLLPKDLADQEFLDTLNSQFQTALTATANSYKSKDPEYTRQFAEVSKEATALNEVLQRLEEFLREVPTDLGASLGRNIRQTRAGVGLITSDAQPDVVEGLVNTQFPALSKLSRDLISDLRAASQDGIAARIESTVADAEKRVSTIETLFKGLPHEKYEAQAKQTLAPAQRALDVFLHSLNIYSIAPVAIFDIARVWTPGESMGEGVHYGVGGGVRLSLVNVNFTVAYTVNLNRVRPESAGALVFKLDVTSLFQ